MQDKLKYSRPPDEGFGTKVSRILKGLTKHHMDWLRDYELETIKAFFLSLSESDRQRFLWQICRRDNYWRSKDGKIVSIGDRLIDSTFDWPEDEDFRVTTISPEWEYTDPVILERSPEVRGKRFQFDDYMYKLKKGNRVIVDATITLSHGLFTQI